MRHSGHHAHHAVIAAGNDVAIMAEYQIGDAAKPFNGLGIGTHNGFAAGVGTGHHQHHVLRRLQPCRSVRPCGRLVKQQVMNGSSRQHDPQRFQPRRHAGEDGVIAIATRQQHHRPLATLQQRRFCIRHQCMRVDAGQIRQHHRKGLGLTILALAQARHRRAVVGIAGEVKAAQSLDGDDGAVAQVLQRQGDRVAVQRDAVGIGQPQARTANRAAGGFGMKAPVRRFTVFLRASGTQGK